LDKRKCLLDGVSIRQFTCQDVFVPICLKKPKRISEALGD